MEKLRKRAAIAVLGCKVNQYEAEAMTEILENAGYEIGEFNEVCDVYVINTCTVTGMSARKSRQMIRKAKNLNKNAVICVAGCYSQISQKEVEDIGGINLIIGTKGRNRITEYLEKIYEGVPYINAVEDHEARPDYEKLHVSNFKEKTRANIKIQDGCSQFCSYCIIPYARGPARNRDFDDIMDEVAGLSSKGFKEIVLTGIHLASFGSDKELIRLIKEISRINGIERIRLGSAEPNLFSGEFIKEIGNMEKLCRHFHISLQSGCEQTLKRMNRKYTPRMYLDVVEKLYESYPDTSITTDIMTGFPGETDEEFNETYEFAKNVKFMKIHVFKYSARKGTKAYGFADQIAEDIKDIRSGKLLQLSEEMNHDYIKRYMNKEVLVLAEQKTEHPLGYNMEGLTANYIRVFYKTVEADEGNIIKVRINKILDEALGAEKM